MFVIDVVVVVVDAVVIVVVVIFGIKRVLSIYIFLFLLRLRSVDKK